MARYRRYYKKKRYNRSRTPYKRIARIARKVHFEN